MRSFLNVETDQTDKLEMFSRITRAQSVADLMTAEQAQNKLREFDLMPYGPFMSCTR